jgi:hypothetical protein
MQLDVAPPFMLAKKTKTKKKTLIAVSRKAGLLRGKEATPAALIFLPPDPEGESGSNLSYKS